MHFISIVELCGIFDRIIQTNGTAECMRAIPFYRAPHWQHEFEHHRSFCKKITEGENARELLRACEVDKIYRFLTKQCGVKKADLLRGSLCFEVYAE